MPSRRDRYESANIRGGMGVRKRLSEESFRPTYRLNGVQRGATIAECLDRFGRWEGGYRLGTLVRKTAHWVYIKWDDEDEVASIDQGDARYAVDRGKWRILAPRIGDPLSGERGVSLTTLAESARIQASANADSTDRGDDEDMVREQSNAAAERESAQKALQNGEFKERDTYTAKQVAGRCGTDAKTMRKFFRSKASTVEPVGQGGRYEFAATDLPKIKREFDAWRKKADSRQSSPTVTEPERKAINRLAEQKMVFKRSDGDHDAPTPKVTPPSSAARTLLEESHDKVEEAVIDHFGDDHEPTDEELEEMAKLLAGDFDILDDDIEDLS